MPALKDAKKEQFAQMVARGVKLVEAYYNAGFVTGEKEDNSRARNGQLASCMAKTKMLSARIEELREIRKPTKTPEQLRIIETRKLESVAFNRALERLTVDKEWVMRGMIEIAERCMQHALVLNPQTGKPIQVEVEGLENRALLCTFLPKEAIRAYELIGKELGMFVERRETKNEHTFAEKYKDMTEQQRLEDASELYERAQEVLRRRAAREAEDIEYTEVKEDEDE
jgi:hypothetical protein